MRDRTKAGHVWSFVLVLSSMNGEFFHYYANRHEIFSALSFRHLLQSITAILEHQRKMLYCVCGNIRKLILKGLRP